MTGSRLHSRPPGQGRLGDLAAAGTAGAVIALAACGSQPSASPVPGGPGTGAAQPAGTTVRVADSIDVISARIPAPAAGSAPAQVEVTVADTSTDGPDRRTGQTVAVSLIFALAGHATLQVPVIKPTP